jgi:hypothetical protein
MDRHGGAQVHAVVSGLLSRERIQSRAQLAPSGPDVSSGPGDPGAHQVMVHLAT